MAGLSKHGTSRMRDVLAGFVERGEVAGLVALVSRGGETHVEAIGRRSVGGDPISRESIFRIASMSKAVTAAAAMILVEECRIRLDDPVDVWLPELADRQVLRKSLDSELDDVEPMSRPITLRDLLTFTFGSGAIMARPNSHPIQKAFAEVGLQIGPPDPKSTPEPNEYMRRLGSLPLIHQPGEGWMYHTGSDVLGVLIARVAGQPFEEFLHERIFKPLSMPDTGFHVRPETIGRFTAAYVPGETGGSLIQTDPIEGSRWAEAPAFPSGGGGLVSTVGDFFTFARMMMQGGVADGVRILSQASVELMTVDHLTAQQKANSGFWTSMFEYMGWGFGMSVVTRQRDLGFSVGAYGWDGGLGTTWRNDPQKDLIGILLTQRSFTSPIPPPACRDFWTTAYQTIDD